MLLVVLRFMRLPCLQLIVQLLLKLILNLKQEMLSSQYSLRMNGSYLSDINFLRMSAIYILMPLPLI